MKKLVIILSIIAILGMIAPGLPTLAQPTQVPHENPTVATGSLDTATILLSYSKIINIATKRQYQSAQDVLDELEMPINDERMSGEIQVIKCGDNDRFTISLNPVRHNVTKVSILVNLLGDKPYAEMIYRHIDAQDGVVQFVTVEELNTAIEERPRRKAA